MIRILLIIFCLFSLLLSSDLQAAKPSGLTKPTSRPEIYTLQNPIEQTQSLLKELGFFSGNVDGIRGPDTIAAIENYQEKHGLKTDGRVSRKLLDHLENIGRVRALIQRLDQVRTSRQNEARQALLSDPRTRKLLEKPDKEVANPMRDPSVCFQAPSPSCLLNEAVESSRAVFEDDLRDWALGEILAAQVRIGLDKEALQTAARIKDSRLIIAALANIAKTHVKEGKLVEAHSGLSLIPLMERRLSVLLDIAQAYYDKGDIQKSTQTITDILSLSKGIKEPQTRLSLQIQAAEILSQHDKKKAAEILENIAKTAKTSEQYATRISILRHVATTMAKIQYPEWALKALNDLPDDESRIPILMTATRAFLKMNRFEAALNTVHRISADRYRGVIFADVARALWHDGQTDKALHILFEAQTLINGIKLPFAKNFALSNIASVMIDMIPDTKDTTLATRAFDLLHSISDNRLKAKGLWSLAHAAQLHNFSITNQNLDDAAINAINGIKSKFSRTWMLGDLANTHMGLGEKKYARKAFDLGLKNAQILTNPWARSRALAKFAALMNSLD